MAAVNDAFTIVPLEFDIFIGMDVDKKSVAITCYDHRQKLSSEKMPNQAEPIIGYTQRHFPGQRVAFTYEAGPTGYGLYDRLTESGYKCLVVTPSTVPSAPNRRVKTNRLDSEKLAKALRGGEITGIRVPSTKYREMRHLIHLHDVVTRQGTQCKCRIKAALLLEGIPYPNQTQSDHWSNNTLRRLETLACAAALRFKLDLLLENLRFHRQQLLKITKTLRHYCRNDPDLSESLEYLVSIPGIGWTIGTHLIARIGDWRNLKNVRELAGFLGLTPCESSTGDDVNKGNITRSGDSRLRNMLIEGAWSAVQWDPEMKEFYQRILARHPHDRAARKAIVAVARKMTTRIYRVLKDRRLYVPRSEGTLDNHRASDRKRRPLAPKDASTLCRTRTYVLKRGNNLSRVLAGSFQR